MRGGNGAGWATSIAKIGSVAGPILGGIVLSTSLPVRDIFAVLAVCPVVMAICIYIVGRLQRRILGREALAAAESAEACSSPRSNRWDKHLASPSPEWSESCISSGMDHDCQYLCSELVTVTYEEHPGELCQTTANLEEISMHLRRGLVGRNPRLGSPISLSVKGRDLFGVITSRHVRRDVRLVRHHHAGCRFACGGANRFLRNTCWRCARAPWKGLRGLRPGP